MPETPTDVLVAGYQSVDAATKDFEALVARVKDTQVEIEGVILVTHDREGNVSVQQTGDHLGRKGAGWGGGVGVAVGLFAPPLLASAAVGAVAGGVIGKFVDHRVQSQIHDKTGENLPPGSAGVIAVFDDEQRLAVEQALGGALLKSVVQSDKSGMQALKDSLAEAMGKFSPDRTVLPIPDRNFGGTIGRTMDQSVADWTIVPGPKAPEGAPTRPTVGLRQGRPSTGPPGRLRRARDRAVRARRPRLGRLRRLPRRAASTRTRRAARAAQHLPRVLENRPQVGAGDSRLLVHAPDRDAAARPMAHAPAVVHRPRAAVGGSASPLG